jgi:methanogenesis imperfect marker protein 11
MVSKWTTSYLKIDAIADENGDYIDLIEESPTQGGSAWIVYQLYKTSPLVIRAKREGTKNIFRLKVGEHPVELKPGLYGAGIEGVKIEDDKIKITYRGIGGSSVGIAARKTAKGVIRAELDGHIGGGGTIRAEMVLPRKERIVIGVDDTDNREQGATWSLIHNIAREAEATGLGSYLSHSITQLYPETPYKTQNCASSSVEFATENSEELVEYFMRKLMEYTLSENTGMAVFRGFDISHKIKEYGYLAKKNLITLEETKAYMAGEKVKLHPITGERGLIGASAALAFYDNPDEGVRL